MEINSLLHFMRLFKKILFSHSKIFSIYLIVNRSKHLLSKTVSRKKIRTEGLGDGPHLYIVVETACSMI